MDRKETLCDQCRFCKKPANGYEDIQIMTPGMSNAVSYTPLDFCTALYMCPPMEVTSCTAFVTKSIGGSGSVLNQNQDVDPDIVNT